MCRGSANPNTGQFKIACLPMWLLSGNCFQLATNRSFITAVFYGSTFATITDVMDVIPISAITLIAFLSLKITLERELSLSPTRT